MWTEVPWALVLWVVFAKGVRALMRTPRPRVLVADDYTDLLVAFKRLLEPSCEVVGCITDGNALVESMARLQPDVIVVDLFIPPSNGLEICRNANT